MTEFEYDCLQEEKRKRGICRWFDERHEVSLPSDHLPPWELERRNGPCRTYRLGRPMTLEAFEELPADLKTRYLRLLRQRGGSASDVEQMLGAAPGGLRVHRIRFDQQDPERWRAFLQPMGKEE